MHNCQKTGILLINTGSPSGPTVGETRRYLRQFLSDPRVIDISPLRRWLLLNLVILPFRPKASAHAYQSIWTERGSPLIAYSEDFRDALRAAFPNAHIEIAMAYGSPSIPDTIRSLVDARVSRIVAVPMFPQYASATTGSVLEAVYRVAAREPNVPPITSVAPYYDDPGYLDAWAEVAAPELDQFQPDHVLMSFHGLPERQIYKCDPTQQHCLKRADCCEHYMERNPDCYRAHCVVTARGIADRLSLAPEDYTLCFQSKLGRDPWLTPATDETIEQRARDGVKRLAILSPAFVADCLETLEELGIQGKEDFKAAGGEDFLLVPSLNTHPRWVQAMSDIIARATGDTVATPAAATPSN